MSGTESPEVDQERVPGDLVLIPSLEAVKGHGGTSPGKSGDEVLVVVHDVEVGFPGFHFGVVGVKDGGGVIVGLLAGDDGSTTFEKLRRGTRLISFAHRRQAMIIVQHPHIAQPAE